MIRCSTLATFGLFAVVAAASASAAPRTMADCRALSDPAARLSCYDTIGAEAPLPAPAPSAAVSSSVAEPSAPSAPVAAPPARTATQAPNSDLKRRSDFDSRIAAVVPQRHGYYRLVLDDGSAYLTTSVAPPVPVGAAVHIRRTVIGTTYLDTPGRDPIAIRLARQQ